MMLTVRELDARHGAIQALRRVSLELDRGRVLALIGANGAGKTTLLHCIAGLHRPVAGRILVAGEDTTGLPAHRLACRGLCLVPAGRQLFAELTVAENLRMGLHGLRLDEDMRTARTERVYELFPILREFTERQAGLLSGGQQQMLAIGRALVRAPRVLLLDEPSLGLAPLLVAQILDTVSRLARGGVAVLLAEQNAAAALRVADQGIVLENGRVTRVDGAATLLADEDVRRHYLGAAGTATGDRTTRTLPPGLDRLAG
jgi:branched-chain amino acid transport system ATP-binding protein